MSSIHHNINYRISPALSIVRTTMDTNHSRDMTPSSINMSHKCHFANCSREFKTQFSLERHALVHSGQKPFICILCSSRFRQNGHLVSHVKKHHGNFLHCPKCKVTFPTVQNLQSHIKICQPKNKKHEIMNSSQSSSSSLLLSSDLLLQNKDETIDVNCNCAVCKCSGGNVKFYSLKQFIGHLSTSTKKQPSSTTTENYTQNNNNNNSNESTGHSHSSKHLNYYQSVNDAEFNSRFNQHMLNAVGVPTKETSFNEHPNKSSITPNNNNNVNSRINNVCHGCGIRIQSPYNFRRHLVRNSLVSLIKCTLCPSEFKFDCAFQKHYRGHKENAEKYHRCEICDKFFTTLPSLRHHMKSIHLNVRNFACPYLCGKQYAKASDLRKHLSVSHDDNSTSTANKNQSQHQNLQPSPYF